MLTKVLLWYSHWLSQYPDNLHDLIRTLTATLIGALAYGGVRLSLWVWKGYQAWQAKRANDALVSLVQDSRPPGLSEALVGEERAIEGIMASGRLIGELMGQIKRERLKTDRRSAELAAALKGGIETPG